MEYVTLIFVVVEVVAEVVTEVITLSLQLHALLAQQEQRRPIE